MHDILIALVFVGMVTYPAITALMPSSEQDEERAVGLPVLSPAKETCGATDGNASRR
jgi:hypothetical protein